MMTSDEIRRKYIEFFQARGHVHFPSDSLVPSNDPTLLFTSAGMVQFKAHFLGQNTDGVTRAVSCQKCFRTTDIERVGYTARHHTFFEMLGNFSFGDYFKREAIQWGWEFVTGVLGLDPERLYPSVYHEDDEAFAIWEQEIGVPAERIWRRGKEDNFWGPVGDSGPCGPCSEIHFDKGAHIAAEGDRYIEIWNLVFTQFDAQPDGTFKPLPKTNIDTGAGLERIAAVMQGKDSNFETDLLWPLIECGERLAGKRYRDSEAVATSLRVLADHGRAAAFAICDGIVPSNEGRGYVLRRIMRRAMMHGRKLGLAGPFFEHLAETTRQLMGATYPELVERFDYCARVMRTEERAFGQTLDRNYPRLVERIEAVKRSGADTLPGEDIFYFHDTLGFPSDLAVDVAIEHGLRCDLEGFTEAMRQQRERARAAAKFAGGFGTGLDEELRVPATMFDGYEVLEESATVLAVIVNGKTAAEAASGVEADVVLDRTPFYAEAGGQVGDQGVLCGADGAMVFTVRDTLKTPGGIWLHRGVGVGTLRVGDRVLARVDAELRRRTACNHTATHLLQAALQRVLGDAVRQSGSRVDADSLRFDYTYSQALTPEQLRRIEELMNEWVWRDLEVWAEEMPLEDARRKGAMALFGEKYANVVRVMHIGSPGDALPISLELCGGTHVRNTGAIGLVKIAGDSAISAGNRRIVAWTRQGAFAALSAEAATLERVAALLKCRPDEAPARVEQLQTRVRQLQKELDKARLSGGAANIDGLLGKLESVEGAPVLAAAVQAGDHKEVLALMDQLRARQPSGVLALGANLGEKLFFVVGVSDDWTGKGLHAGNLVKAIAGKAGGSGGGKADWAQAGAKDTSKLEEALASAADAVRAQLRR